MAYLIGENVSGFGGLLAHSKICSGVRRRLKPVTPLNKLMVFTFYLFAFLFCSSVNGVESDAPGPVALQDRPAIIDSITPSFLAKTTVLDISADRQLKMKQIRLSDNGVLLVEIFSAKTSLPDSLAIDRGILRSVAFEAIGNELKIYVSLTEPVVYEVESTDRGLKVLLQNPILEHLVSIDVNNEPISTVLLMLFTQYGANIIAGSRVSGKVTAHLVDVPLKAALDEILKAEGYGYVEEDGLIRVLAAEDIAAIEVEKDADNPPPPPVETESRLFELKFANARDTQQIIREFISNEGNVLVDERTNSIIVMSTKKNIHAVEGIIQQLDKEVEEKEEKDKPSEPQIKQEEEEIVKRIFKLEYMDPDNAMTILEPLLSEKGTIAAIKEKKEETRGAGSEGTGGTGGTVATGTAGIGMQQEEAVGQGGYIVVSDKKQIVEQIAEEITRLDIPTPQVCIEACIVEGALSENFELGIDWSAINEDEEVSLSFSGDRGAVLTKGIIPGQKFIGILNSLSSNSDMRVLSNPSITTLQGQPAMFHSGDRIPYSKIFIQDGIEQVDTVFEDVGIVLAVTPYVKENDMISLLLSTSVSNEGGFTPAGQPRIATRNTQSQVLVKSGDTVTIAGLISEKDSIAVSKVPLIGDIPLIGRVFTTESKINQRSEVTIFITPTIVTGEQETVSREQGILPRGQRIGEGQ